LLLKLSDPDPHARNFAYLVTRALLGILSAENHIDVVQRVLDAMAITTLDDMDGFVKGADTLLEVGHSWIYDHRGNVSTDYLVLERYELGQQRGLETSEPQHAALVADIVTLHDPNSSSTTR